MLAGLRDGLVWTFNVVTESIWHGVRNHERWGSRHTIMLVEPREYDIFQGRNRETTG